MPDGNGTLEGGYCIAGIEDVLRIRAPGGVDFIVDADIDREKRSIELDIDVVIPEGRTVSFRSSEVLLESQGWPGPVSLRIESVQGALGASYAPSDPIPGPSETALQRMSVVLNSNDVEDPAHNHLGIVPAFEARLPAVLVDREEFELGVVRFSEYRRWGMYYCIQ